jgi:hypothetical protein
MHTQQVTNRCLNLLALIMIVAVAPWSLAYQHPYDGSSFLIDFATFIILVSAEFLRVGKKNKTTWI